MTLPTRRPGRALTLLRADADATAAMPAGHWPAQLTARLSELEATWQESAQVCADAAWTARAAGHSVLDLLRAEDAVAAGPDPIATRVYRHLYLSALRFDFRCPTLASLVEQLPPQEREGLDCYTRALYAFALLGQSRADGLPLLDQVLAEADDHPKTLHVLLHGLWLGHTLPGRAERMLAIAARPPFAARTDPIVLFREAGALRQLGEYQAALESIDRALDLLPPGDVSVHADLVRERSLITASRDIHAIVVRGTAEVHA
jgi:tetratricopeptide (TPR) repeat protein